MNGKRIAAFALLALFLAASLGFAQAAQKKAKSEPRVFIPKEVKAVMEAGLLTKQARLDIPFAITGHLYLPAGTSFQNIFTLEAVNKDLGFAPPSPTPAAQARDKAFEGPGQPEPVTEMRAAFSLFVQFREISAGLPGQLVKEVYVPCTEVIPAAQYDPEKKEAYYVGYPLPAGKYIATLALTTNDLKTIGIQYLEFSTPDPAAFTDRIDTTPVFTAKSIERMEAPEDRTILHKDFFTYSILKIVPNINNVISPDENLDIFYFVFGARPDSEQKYGLETTFEVKKGEESVIKFAPAVMDSPLVSLPLPLKRSLVTQTEAGEKREDKNLEAGNYALMIKITDKNTGLSVTKNLNFIVQ
ncbi:MAG: hypothetical protein FJY83_02760 [Candidatus Aminicenantes bacterium]|nr:hypothetical protein [Candidatus Aminicenantes bacterium]